MDSATGVGNVVIADLMFVVLFSVYELRWGLAPAVLALAACNDLSAEPAERDGYINRALPADELKPFVEKPAHRIASFPGHAIAHAKAAVDTGVAGPLLDGATTAFSPPDRMQRWSIHSLQIE